MSQEGQSIMNFNNGLPTPDNLYFVTSGQQTAAADNSFINASGHHSQVVTTVTSHINAKDAYVNLSPSVQPIISG